ncbi:MAG: hypothetical protein HGB10_07700 [Coriobacteriia bacterium]|nr:hypothetical protein [Coriobacteriia bacterium]
MPRRPRREFDANRSLVKLIAASVLLNVLILAGFLTSTPERSPVSAWATALYTARYRIAPLERYPDGAARLARLHLDAANVSKPECIACHGSELDSRIVLHRIHLTSELLPGLVCHDCHHRIDLSARDNVSVTRWVDVGFCKKCHTKFSGLSPGSSMTPTDYEVDCTTCHTGKHALRHEQPYLSQIIAPSECKGCHGGRVLPWTDLHEEPEWLKTHGKEALRVGTDNCLQCHDFGLKFCDSCHAIKPPTHLPADRWKVAHQDAARADTRACATCHRIDFCKKCHVVHEAGWKRSHPAAVLKRGTTSCERCHSLSFCSYCHTRETDSVETTVSEGARTQETTFTKP